MFLLGAILLAAQAPRFEPGVRIAYAQAPAWTIESDGRIEAARHDVEVRIEGERARVETFTLLRNPSLMDARGRLVVGQVRQDSDGLPWAGTPEIRFQVTLDRAAAAPVDAASSTSLSRVVGGFLVQGAPATSTLGYRLDCPAKTEVHAVVVYEAPLGRVADRPTERIFAYDLGPLSGSKARPRVFVRMPRSPKMRLVGTRPPARVSRRLNGQALEIDRIDASVTPVLSLHFETP